MAVHPHPENTVSLKPSNQAGFLLAKLLKTTVPPSVAKARNARHADYAPFLDPLVPQRAAVPTAAHHGSHAEPSPSPSRPYTSRPTTRTCPATYEGPFPLPRTQSTSLSMGTHGS